MFPVFIQRTSNAISTILNHKCNYEKIIFLRLCKRSYFKNSINRAWDKNTLDTFKKFPEGYKHFICYRKYGTEVHEIDDTVINVKERETDDKVIRDLLVKSVHYENTLMQPVKANVIIPYKEICDLYITDWNEAPASFIYEALKKISYCYLRGTRFEKDLYYNLVSACMNNLNKLDNFQIKILMQHLSVLRYDINKSCNWLPFIMELNRQCLERFYPSTIEEMLLISDAFNEIVEFKVLYQVRALRRIARQTRQLSGRHLLQLLFLTNKLEINTSFINMFEVEDRATKCISDLSANEIGILARGFFMSERKLKNTELQIQMLKGVTKNIKFMQSNTLAAVMKLLRYTGCKYCHTEFQLLLDSLNTEIPRLELKCLTHIAHALGGSRIYNKELLDEIIERIKKEIKSARLKDIERILFAIYSVAPYDDYYQETCQILLNEILETYQTDRAYEIQTFPISLVRIVTYLIDRNFDVPQLIEHVMNFKFVQNMHQNNKTLTNDMLILQHSVKIDMPDYKGPFLPRSTYNFLLKKWVGNNNIRRKWSNISLQTEVQFICKHNLGINLYNDFILPHLPVKDAVFGFDEHDNCIEIESILSSMPLGSIKYVNTENLNHIKWNVLCIIYSHVSLYGRTDLTGSMIRKLRHLQAIGYRPIEIYENEWNLLTSDKEKENYLKTKIYEM